MKRRPVAEFRVAAEAEAVARYLMALSNECLMGLEKSTVLHQ